MNSNKCKNRLYKTSICMIGLGSMGHWVVWKGYIKNYGIKPNFEDIIGKIIIT